MFKKIKTRLITIFSTLLLLPTRGFAVAQPEYGPGPSPIQELYGPMPINYGQPLYGAYSPIDRIQDSFATSPVTSTLLFIILPLFIITTIVIGIVVLVKKRRKRRNV